MKWIKWTSLGLVFITLVVLSQLVNANELSTTLDTWSTPIEGAEVYPDMNITYFFDLGITSLADGEAWDVTITSPDALYITCDPIATETVTYNQDLGMYAMCSTKSATPYGISIVSPIFEVKVNGVIIPINTPHAGFQVVTDVTQTGSTNEFLSTILAITQHPNRLLNGLSDINGNIQRRNDLMDLSYTDLQLVQPKHMDPMVNVYPIITTISGSPNYHVETTRDNYAMPVINICSGRNSCYVDSISGCSGTYCTQANNGSTCQFTVLSDLPLSTTSLVQGSQINYYNPTSTPSTITHISDLSSNNVDVSAGVELPDTYPSLEFGTSSFSKTKNYQVKDSANQLMDANDFIRLGAQFNIPREDFKSFAIWNGKSGAIDATLSGNVTKTVWQYGNFGSYNTGRCHVRYRIPYSCGCPDSCGTCYHNRTDERTVSIPTYFWKRIEGPTSLPFDRAATTFVDVFSSTAWVQTKGGNLGTNNDLSSVGITQNILKYSEGESFLDNITRAQSNTAPKDYAPLDQFNSEFMIFAKKPPMRVGDITEFSSESNWYYEIPDDVQSSFSEDEKKQMYGFGLHGDEYDRALSNSPRKYSEDMIDRELFGEVIDFSNADVQGNLSRFGDIAQAGNTFTITRELLLERGKIYFFPTGYTVILGNEFSDLVLKGSSSRLRVEGSVFIEGNIIYGSHQALSYLDIANLRIDADTITVNGRVEYIESQLQAEVFYSGESNIQLKILGDVIADETHFQRSPSNVYNPESVKRNPPSELIIEDLRKFIVPAPGDTILRDSQNWWQQVNPLTGEVVDPY